MMAELKVTSLVD
jgi:hypothetical protein